MNTTDNKPATHAEMIAEAFRLVEGLDESEMAELRPFYGAC